MQLQVFKPYTRKELAGQEVQLVAETEQVRHL